MMPPSESPTLAAALISTIIAAALSIGHSFGMEVVVEGVETEAQWQYLRNREANQVQGFLFCRPLTVADLDRWHTDWLHSSQLRAASVA